ncbi:unnamed protein product, partial [Staurois parvus]
RLHRYLYIREEVGFYTHSWREQEGEREAMFWSMVNKGPCELRI